ncbi:putative VP4 [Microviridae sp.]|nr:putative VP4 [Microviridae sp.]
MDLIKHIYAHCFNPVKVKVCNPVTGEVELRDVPCGKCYHCRITKVNEWCTRMVLESKARKYTYFVTLTYSPRSLHTEVFRETYPCTNRCNTYGKEQPMPLVLRKDHLQKFNKRLRKNTGIKYKYFACGEYGHKYGRPHYHMIIWSDVPISKIDIYRAWSTIDDYGRRVIIGDIDYNLISENHLLNKEQMSAFKYVCKYLQKGEFDFKKLPTYQYHDKLKDLFYGKSEWSIPKYSSRLWIEGRPIENADQVDDLYRKRFSPFMLCSKSPAIGFDYLSENIDRFKTGDFRLFGLPKDGKFILPAYFVRKTKELCCPYCRINEETENLRTNATIPDLVSMLVEVQNCLDFVESFQSIQPVVYQDPVTDKITFENTSRVGPRILSFSVRFFRIYDKLNHRWFDFNGTDYRVYRRTRIGIQDVEHVSVQEVITRLQTTYQYLYDNILCPQTNQRMRTEREMQEYIAATYGDSWNDVQATYRATMMDKVAERQRKYKLTKNKF